ncbi:jg12851 [Pararge aegeria aegeria]|uniref:Jg12851 protein n=1 Tax=Pararge aegeria aegeria TaxID=348720 RepID=A0A8S4S8B1_9NEOP|nr:jg12851 [Pararge aegeria aegeria]
MIGGPSRCIVMVHGLMVNEKPSSKANQNFAGYKVKVKVKNIFIQPRNKALPRKILNPRARSDWIFGLRAPHVRSNLGLGDDWSNGVENSD